MKKLNLKYEKRCWIFFLWKLPIQPFPHLGWIFTSGTFHYAQSFKCRRHEGRPKNQALHFLCKGWGFGSLFVGNLFALKSTKPTGLLESTNPEGPENLKYLLKLSSHCKMIVCAWGNGTILKKLSANSPKNLNRKLHCLKLSLDGIPCHPLYLPKDLKPIEWKAGS